LIFVTSEINVFYSDTGRWTRSQWCMLTLIFLSVRVEAIQLEKTSIIWNGHSFVDSVSFTLGEGADSVDHIKKLPNSQLLNWCELKGCWASVSVTSRDNKGQAGPGSFPVGAMPSEDAIEVDRPAGRSSGSDFGVRRNWLAFNDTCGSHSSRLSGKTTAPSQFTAKTIFGYGGWLR